MLEEIVQAAQQVSQSTITPIAPCVNGNNGTDVYGLSPGLITPPDSNTSPSSGQNLWSSENHGVIELGAPINSNNAFDFSTTDFDPRQPFDETNWSDTCKTFGPFLDTSTHTGEYDFSPQDMIAFGSGAQFGPAISRDPVSSVSLDPDMLLKVPEIDTFRAFIILADMLQSRKHLFDVTAVSIFNTPNAKSLMWYKGLAANWQPVDVQFTIPHHPMLDLIPWPSVRRKIIIMFSLPESEWPKDCQGTSLGFMEFISDLDSGGVEVKGLDPVKEEAWEVAEMFAQKWWWCLDPKILKTADKWRHERGEKPLKLASFSGKY